MLQETNSKSFPEIYAVLTESQRSDLRRRLVISIGIKDNTLWNWGTGKTQPTNKAFREACAEAVNAVLLASFTPAELFPSK